MKKIFNVFGMMIILFASFTLSPVFTYAQDEADSTQAEPQKERPARPAFESGLLFDNATATIPAAKTLELVIQHRFGSMENGISDFFGIWSPSNIRLGLNFSILNNLTVGIGATKFKKMEDLQIKYNLLQQTRSNSIPLTITLYEVIGIDGRNKDIWGTDYKFSNRISYFSQVILSRRFNDMFSLQIAPSFTHYNAQTDSIDHDRITLSAAGRIKFSPQSSLIVSGDFPLVIQNMSEWREDVNKSVEKRLGSIEPNFAIGLEVSTSTHAFHVYVGTSQLILPQENMMFNYNQTFLIGLNVTRLWGF
jgi:hypothetical protein